MKKLSLLLLSVATALLFQSCNNEDGNNFGNDSSITPAVEAVQAQFGGLPLEERLNGIVSARNQVDIYSRISAPVEEIYALNGEIVSQGDPLLKLRDTEYRERLRQAEANLRITIAQRRQAEAALGKVESQLRRERVLAERDLSSELEIEQSTVIPLSAIYRNPQSGVTGVYVATSFGVESAQQDALDRGESTTGLSNPTDVEFIPIEVVARGRDAAGVSGIRSGDWVVTVGQHLLARDDSEIARVRHAVDQYYL